MLLYSTFRETFHGKHFSEALALLHIFERVRWTIHFSLNGTCQVPKSLNTLHSKHCFFWYHRPCGATYYSSRLLHGIFVTHRDNKENTAKFPARTVYTAAFHPLQKKSCMVWGVTERKVYLQCDDVLPSEGLICQEILVALWFYVQLLDRLTARQKIQTAKLGFSCVNVTSKYVISVKS